MLEHAGIIDSFVLCAEFGVALRFYVIAYLSWLCARADQSFLFDALPVGIDLRMSLCG